MSSPPVIPPDSPMAKVLAESRAGDVRRLRLVAQALRAVIPPDGVLFDRILRRQAVSMRVLFCWPGTLMALDPIGGEIFCEAEAANMHDEMPPVAAFMVQKMKGRPLKVVTFQPPQGIRLIASIGADGVVRAHAAIKGELLAESEPGQPTVLRAGFRTLIPRDLAPRIS